MSTYKVEISFFQNINELPNSWEKTDYLALLNLMDYDHPEEIDDAELPDMCMMALTDYEPAEAAGTVLTYVIQERLTEGQIENLSHEILTEKLWEEYPELSLHPDLFRATQLLYKAYNGKFPRAEAVQFKMKIQGDLSIFDENPKPAIVRLLAAGMSDHSLIHRLFSDQMEGTCFPEANDIIWQLNMISKTDQEIVYEIVSSTYWLEEIKYANEYEASSHADSPAEEED